MISSLEREDMRNVKSGVCWLIIAVISIICGACLIFEKTIIFDCVVSLQCNPLLYHYWKKIPVDIPTEIYIFNWTNPEDIYNKSVKPTFAEIGPYTFLQKEEKCNITWNNNGTVTFQQRKFWYFDETRTNGTLQDNVTNVDPGILSISYIIRRWNYLIRKGTFLTLKNFFTSSYKTAPVSQLLFDGYPQPLMKVASSLPFFSDLKVPAWERFGWMYKRNGSADFDGVFTMGTGTNSVFGKLYKWNYESRTEYFEGRCGEVSGSAGQFFPRNLNKKFIDVFSTDFRRTLSLEFVEQTRVDGIVGFKYRAGSYTFDNGTLNVNNKCFCTGECIPTGVVNISLTRHHSPIFVSLPHYYGADPYYLSLVDGLKPDESKHDVSVTIEPTTGIILEADAKFQLNLLMQPISGTELFENVPKVYFPMLWIKQKAKIPNSKSLLLKLILALPVVCVCLGGLLIVSSIVLIFCKACKYQKQKRRTCENEKRNSTRNEENLSLHMYKN